MNVKFVAALSSFIALSSCGHRPDTSSRVQHDWGHTRRGQVVLSTDRSCAPDFAQTPEARRLQTLARKIALANPQTFSGHLAIENFCIGVDPAITKIDARTSPDALRVAFSVPLIALAQNDDELAAVLSHELAHATLQHAGFGEAPPRLKTDAQFLAWEQQGRAIQRQVVELALTKADPQLIFKLNEQFGELLGKMNRRIDEVYGEENAHRNWIEQEADEVGAEFFVRAGFQRESFLEFLWRSSSTANAEQRLACQQTIVQALRGSAPIQRPSRGSGVHPTTCWRVFHLKVDEWAHAHAGELATLNLR